MTHHIYLRLRTEWAGIAHSADSHTALQAVARREPAIAALGLRDLGELVDYVQRHRDAGLPATAAPRLVTAVLRAADADPLVTRALLQMLYPGVAGVARGLGSLRRAWAGEHRPWAVREVMSAVRLRLRRQALRVETERRHHCHVDLSEIPAPDDGDLGALAAALDQPGDLGIGAQAAAVISLTRVHGYTLGEVAMSTGTSPAHLQYLRAKAERCLVAG